MRTVETTRFVVRVFSSPKRGIQVLPQLHPRYCISSDRDRKLLIEPERFRKDELADTFRSRKRCKIRGKML